MEVNKFRWEFGALTTPAFRKPVLPDVSTNGNIRSANPERVSGANCRSTTRLVRDKGELTTGEKSGVEEIYHRFEIYHSHVCVINHSIAGDGTVVACNARFCFETLQQTASSPGLFSCLLRACQFG